MEWFCFPFFWRPFLPPLHAIFYARCGALSKFNLHQSWNNQIDHITYSHYSITIQMLIVVNFLALGIFWIVFQNDDRMSKVIRMEKDGSVPKRKVFFLSFSFLKQSFWFMLGVYAKSCFSAVVFVGLLWRKSFASNLIRTLLRFRKIRSAEMIFDLFAEFKKCLVNSEDFGFRRVGSMW